MQQMIARNLVKGLMFCTFAMGVFGFSPAEAQVGKGAPQIVLPKLNLLDIMEINAGRMGDRKACNDRVEEFAQKLVTDHTAHRAQVLALAKARSVRISPARVSQAEYREIRRQQATQRRLQAMRTCAFDKAFATAMVDAHRFAIEVVRASMTNQNGTELRAFLDATLVSLTAHHTEAQALVAHLNGETAPAPSPTPTPTPDEEEEQEPGQDDDQDQGQGDKQEQEQEEPQQEQGGDQDPGQKQEEEPQQEDDQDQGQDDDQDEQEENGQQGQS